jgi:hypothetical protein
MIIGCHHPPDATAGLPPPPLFRRASERTTRTYRTSIPDAGS